MEGKEEGGRVVCLLGLGQRQAQQHGRVSVEDRGLLIAPEQIDVGLPGIVNDALSQAARDLVTIRQSIEGLPERLVLTAISVRPHGFQVTLRGVDVVLAQAGG